MDIEYFLTKSKNNTIIKQHIYILKMKRKYRFKCEVNLVSFHHDLSQDSMMMIYTLYKQVKLQIKGEHHLIIKYPPV